jgi:hypothetical protein
MSALYTVQQRHWDCGIPVAPTTEHSVESLNDVWTPNSNCLYGLIEHFSEAFYPTQELPTALLTDDKTMVRPDHEISGSGETYGAGTGRRLADG